MSAQEIETKDPLCRLGTVATKHPPQKTHRKHRKPNATEIVNRALSTATTASTRHFISVTTDSLSRIEKGKKDGKEFLSVVFPLKLAEPIEISYDLSFLLAYPGISDALAEAFLIHGQSNAHTSRESFRTSFIKLVGFLGEAGLHNIQIDDFKRPIWTALVKYLDNLQLKQTTKTYNYIHVKRAFDILAKVPRWKDTVAPLIPEILLDPWPGYKRRITPTPPIADDQYEAIIRAAEDEVLLQEKRFTESEKLIQDGRKANLLTPEGWKTEAGQLMAHILDSRDGGLITKDAWKNAGVSHALRRSYQKINAQMFPTQRDIIPFVLLLADATAYNPDGVRSLQRSHITRRTNEATMKQVIIIAGVKFRGQRSATPKPQTFDGEEYPDQLSMNKILEVLERISGRVRQFVQTPEHRDRLFLFKDHLHNFQSFHLENETTKMDTSANQLKTFSKDHGLSRFTINQFRTTVLNREMQLTGDLRSGQRLGLQRSITVVQNHYTSGATRKKFQEQVGEVLQLRNRYFDSEGKIDPRKLSLTQDKGAATPGFDCVDPLDSPRLGQNCGRICDAYGECPGCPNVILNPNRVENVALWLALRAAIYRAQVTVSPETWTAKWAPIVEELEGLLCHVPPEIVTKSSQIPITLPPVG